MNKKMDNKDPNSACTHKAQRYLELGDEIKKLEAERNLIKKDLDSTLQVGFKVLYAGGWYEWVEYERSSTSWKSLYEGAFSLLDDEGQVIMGEQEAKIKKVAKHKRFDLLD